MDEKRWAFLGRRLYELKPELFAETLAALANVFATTVAQDRVADRWRIGFNGEDDPELMH